MKFKDIFIDQEKSGISQFLLTDVRDWIEYKDGKRTDKILGKIYEVAMPKRMLEKMTVHVRGNSSLTPKMQQVSFQNLQISIYSNYRNPSELGVNAIADGIKEVTK